MERSSPSAVRMRTPPGTIASYVTLAKVSTPAARSARSTAQRVVLPIRSPIVEPRRMSATRLRPVTSSAPSADAANPCS